MNQENSGGLSKDNSGAENHCTIFTIAESPLNENVIWAETDDGNIQLTKDGGKSWTNVVANIQDYLKIRGVTILKLVFLRRYRICCV
jgi:hypothetical protein